jgi:hypothetical protein
MDKRTERFLTRALRDADAQEISSGTARLFKSFVSRASSQENNAVWPQ